MSAPTTVSLTLQEQVNATLASAGGIAPWLLNLSPLLSAAFSNGTGGDKANQLFASQFTLNPAGSVSVNLHNFGGVNDAMGNPFALATVKLLILQMLGGAGGFTDADQLTWGGDGTANSWTSLLGANNAALALPEGTLLNPGGFRLLSGGNGWAVGSANNNLLKFQNTGLNAFSFFLLVLGATA